MILQLLPIRCSDHLFFVWLSSVVDTDSVLPANHPNWHMHCSASSMHHSHKSIDRMMRHRNSIENSQSKGGQRGAAQLLNAQQFTIHDTKIAENSMNSMNGKKQELRANDLIPFIITFYMSWMNRIIRRKLWTTFVKILWIAFCSHHFSQCGRRSVHST